MDDSNSSDFYNAEDLRAFLLGRLSEADAAPIEERMIADETFFQEVQAMEDEIIDEYVMGNLPSVEGKYFLQCSERQPELSRRIAMRKAFFAALRGQSKHPARHSSRPASHLFSWLLVSGVALAAAALLVVCVVLWQGKRGLEIQLAQVERTQESAGLLAPRADQQLQAAAPRFSTMARMFFPAHIARGASGQVPLQVSAATSRLVEFELETPVEASSTQRWSVSIANEQGTSILQTGMRAQWVGSVSFVRAYIDPSTLGLGNYSVLLSREAGSQPGHAMRWRLMVTK